RILGIQVARTAGESGPGLIRGLANVSTSLVCGAFRSTTTIDTAGEDFGDQLSQRLLGAVVSISRLASFSTLRLSVPLHLTTRRPFDLDEGWTFSGSAEGDYGSVSKEVDPTISGLIGWQNDKVGFLVSAVTTEKNLATDYNGYFDTSEDGGIGATNNNHTWSTPAIDADIHHVVPQGFSAFHKEEERHRDGLNLSFQANLTDSIELIADYFYSKQERYNR